MDFSAVYQDFQPKIYRYLCHFSGESEAADLTQTVFLKVSQSLDGFRGESSLSTWIYRIATNTAYDYAASSLVRQKESEQLFDDDGSVDDLPDAGSQGTDREYIREYIEIFYNRQRRHSRLGYLAPAVFAQNYSLLQAAA